MWNIAPERLPRISERRALILDRDHGGDVKLRWALAGLGYQVDITDDLDTMLDIIRASAEPITVFFDVEAPRETLAGDDFAGLIGSLLNERALVSKHIFAAISRTPLEVEITLGKVLSRLEIPVFTKPCDVVAIERYLAHAVTYQDAYAVPTQYELAQLATI